MIVYEIKKRLGTLSVSGSYEKQVNLVSWNGADAVVDIRVWNTETGKPQKGITIKANELPALIKALTVHVDAPL